MHSINPRTSREESQKLLKALSQWWLPQSLSGARFYLVTLMFCSLPGDREAQLRAMGRKVEIFNRLLLTRIFRNPRRVPTDVLPLAICVPDLAVRAPEGVLLLNDGLHFHIVYMISPTAKVRMLFPDAIEVVGAQMVREGSFVRWHQKPIADNLDGVLRYVLKSLGRGGLEFDHIVFLPNAPSELGT